jgi:hypothetical protein
MSPFQGLLMITSGVLGRCHRLSEHHESSDNRAPERILLDEAARPDLIEQITKPLT